MTDRVFDFGLNAGGGSDDDDFFEDDIDDSPPPLLGMSLGLDAGSQSGDDDFFEDDIDDSPPPLLALGSRKPRNDSGQPSAITGPSELGSGLFESPTTDDFRSALRRVRERFSAEIDALVNVAGWPRQKAEGLAMKVEKGEMTASAFRDRVRTEIERAESNGRFVSPPVREDDRVPNVDRRRRSGRFVDQDRSETDISRDPDSGQYQRRDGL